MEALRKTTLPLVATAAVGLGLIAGGGQAQATVTCSKVAAVTGSDSAAGTEAAPFRSAQKLADSLTIGEVGCLRSGTFDTQNQVKVTRPGITLTSFPGERATVKGRLWVDAHDVTVADLNIDGRNQTGLPSPSVTGSGNTFRGLDVTNHHTGICFSLGHPDWARAVDTVIEDSRIHDCGHLPATNYDHGIYVSAADGTIIRDNWIYDNADRGIQLYTDADDSRITRNVIDGNGAGIIFGGSPSVDVRRQRGQAQPDHQLAHPRQRRVGLRPPGPSRSGQRGPRELHRRRRLRRRRRRHRRPGGLHGGGQPAGGPALRRSRGQGLQPATREPVRIADVRRPARG